jgi:cobalt-zinc-cadmium efflux system membrane fusion protein
VRRDAQLGEATGNAALFTIADLSNVWVELDVFDKDLDRVRTGQPVEIETLGGDLVEGKIDWLSPMVSHASQSVQARVILSNSDGRFRPGQYVRGRVTIAENSVPLAIRKSGIQRFRDFKVVFARFDDTYEVRMLELGRHDHDWIEVLGGLKPATEYVINNSYLIKADIEKSGASHDH